MSVALVKLAALLGGNEKFRKGIGWIAVAVLSPVIVLIVLLLAMGSGNAQHNQSVAEICFNGGTVPANAPPEYAAYITDMQTSFSKIDSAVTDMQNETEGDESPDVLRIKALFFSLYFGTDTPSAKEHRTFADCFVTYEERTRIITTTDDEGNEIEEEETYTVLIPIGDLETIYANIQSAMGVTVTDEQIANADSVYNLIKYGAADLGGGSGSGFDDSAVPYIGADGFCSPVGEGWRRIVTSEFGTRTDPFTHRQRYHSGLDLAVPKGTAIRAALPGTVTKAEYNAGGYGWYVLIDHGNGLATLYAHNSSLRARVGQTVNAGDIVSVSGSTGRSTGPHLHFEVRVNGNKVNPRQYLP